MGGGGDPSAGLKRWMDSRLPGSILGQPRLAGGSGQAASCCLGQLPRVGEAAQPLRAGGTRPHSLRPPGLRPWGFHSLGFDAYVSQSLMRPHSKRPYQLSIFPQKIFVKITVLTIFIRNAECPFTNKGTKNGLWLKNFLSMV